MARKKNFLLSILPEKMGVCHFDEDTKAPAWADGKVFSSITRSAKELSVVCPQDAIPAGVLFEKDWRVFKLEGILHLFSFGVISALAAPLAKAKISIFCVSTYETNYILVEEKNFAKAKKALSPICQFKK